MPKKKKKSMTASEKGKKGCIEFWKHGNCSHFPFPHPAPKGDWEESVWEWITKEMPAKHSDRFIPLFKIISQLIAEREKEAYERGYKDGENQIREINVNV